MSNKRKEPTPDEEKLPETAQEQEKAAQAAQPDPGAAAPEEKSVPEPKTEPEAQAEAPPAEAQLKAERDKYLRLLAEYDNYRKRSGKERESIYADVRADTVTKFLPVYDNLARALEQSTEDEAYRKGVELIMAQLQEILRKLGVCEIKALGERFDPALHNAVMHEEDETKGENEIVQELQKGFKMGDKVIRFAMVKVAN